MDDRAIASGDVVQLHVLVSDLRDLQGAEPVLVRKEQDAAVAEVVGIDLLAGFHPGVQLVEVVDDGADSSFMVRKTMPLRTLAYSSVRAKPEPRDEVVVLRAELPKAHRAGELQVVTSGRPGQPTARGRISVCQVERSTIGSRPRHDEKMSPQRIRTSRRSRQ